MQRYFGTLNGDEAVLAEADQHHLLDVMRGRVGQEIEIVFQGKLYLARIETIHPLKIRLEGEENRLSELPKKLFLAYALLKHGNDELVLEKGTELGVAAFYPFISSRTIIRLDEEMDKKKRLERYSKIIKGASEQSKRSLIPELHPILSYAKILDEKADLKLFAYENESENVASFPEALSLLKEGQSCLIVIGPEGGFSPEEAELARQKGFAYVSLGRRILRAETAALYAASVFSFVSESK
jgi:16S rRNA (uracil1498-N3)-methyltransferase